MDNIFNKYDDYIISKHLNKFQPINAANNLNAVTNTIDFSIDCGDNFLNMEDAKFYIKGSLLKKDGTDYTAGLTIKLVDNFPAHLFKTIEIIKDERVVERLENVGRVSTISGIVTSSTLKDNICSGFKSTCKGGKFEAYGNLSDFGLGFFKHSRFPVYKGNMRITFTRNSDKDAIYRWGDGVNLPGEGKITIDDFILKIPVLKYHESEKAALMKELRDLSKNGDYKFVFPSMSCVCDQNVPQKSTYEYRLTNVRTPEFVFVAFQTDRFEDELKDSSNFDSCNVRNISILCDDIKYPKDLQNGDFKESKFLEFYDMFHDYKKVFNIFPLMSLTPTEFNENKPVFVFDLTRHPKNLGSSTGNVILQVDFNGDVPANTRCYICFQTVKEFDYDIVTNTLKENF